MDRLVDDENEFRIRIKVKITYDFVAELLSQNGMMRVIAPAHLRNRLAEIHKNAIKMLKSI